MQATNKGHREIAFELRDWVRIHMKKEQFLVQRRNKLLPRGGGPFQVVKRINNNAYKFDLSSEYGVHTTFNVADLSPYLSGDKFDLGTNYLQDEGNDGTPMADQALQGSTIPHSSNDQLVLHGPLTRDHAKKFKESF